MKRRWYRATKPGGRNTLGIWTAAIPATPRGLTIRCSDLEKNAGPAAILHTFDVSLFLTFDFLPLVTFVQMLNILKRVVDGFNMVNEKIVKKIAYAINNILGTHNDIICDNANAP